MRLYRVSFEGCEHQGYRWFHTMREAKLAMSDCDPAIETEMEQVELEPTKDAIIRALNLYGGHPDNG